MNQLEKKFHVYGKIIIPVYFPTYNKSKKTALERVANLLNERTFKLLDGHLHTTDGKSHVILASRCQFEWIEALGEHEV